MKSVLVRAILRSNIRIVGAVRQEMNKYTAGDGQVKSGLATECTALHNGRV